MTPPKYGNIYASLRHHAEQQPDKTLIAVEDAALSYREFIHNTRVIAAGLRSLGVAANQKIALILPNSLCWYEIFWAAVSIGAQPVPLDPQIGSWEIERLMTLTEIAVCFAASKYRANPILENLLQVKPVLPHLTHIITTDPDAGHAGEVLPFADFQQMAQNQDAQNSIYDPGDDDLLMLACTSGSTGNPKIIAVPHVGFHQSQADMSDYLGFCPSDKILLGMPLYHQGGLGMGIQMAVRGGTVSYQPVFDPEKFLRYIQEHRVTVVQLTPTLSKILLSVPNFADYDISSVRLCYFAGEMLPQEVAQVFFETLKIRVVNIIGSSETATMVVWDSDYDRAVDVNSFRPLAFTAMQILNAERQEVADGDIGTLWIHTDALLQEYYRNPAESADKIRWVDGLKWFDTGDLGRKRADGRVQFVGRSKRVIKRGANFVCPEENEAFLLTHPDIEAVAVMAEQHELMGEMIVAYIQPRQGCALTRGDILKFCRGKLAAYKVPDKVVVMDAIPRDIGKVQFKYLQQQPTGGSNA